MNNRLTTFCLVAVLPSLALADTSTGVTSGPASTTTLSQATQAQQQPLVVVDKRRSTIRAAATVDRLSDDLPNWREYGVAFNQDINNKHFYELGLLRTSRFDLDDNQINGLYLHKFTPDLVTTIEGSVSPTHRVLPKYSLGLNLNYTFLPATVGQIGVKTTSYDQTRVNQVSIGVERYFGSYSVGATYRPARAFGESIHGGEIRANYYYGERSSIGVLAAAGEEVTPIGQQRVIADVRAAALIGQHWFRPNWAITYAMSRTKQGDFYNRTGFNIGLQHAF